jgi:hypothetical protein
MALINIAVSNRNEFALGTEYGQRTDTGTTGWVN